MRISDIKFSIIIPTRNRPLEFEKALKSVLAQSYSNLEIIVVNDGTSKEFKNAYQVLESSYSSENLRFVHLMERSRGHGHCFARNEGVELATGHYICFLDDDDYWIDNDFLLRAQEYIEKYKADYYIANQQAVTLDGTIVENVWVEDLPNKLPQSDERLKEEVFKVSISELFSVSGFPHQNCSIIKNSIYRTVGGMDENLRYEPDRDIFLRVIDEAKVIVYDRNVVSLHNIPDNTKSTNASTKTNKFEKLLFQLRTAEKSILFSKNKDIENFSLCQKGYVLKKIAHELYEKKAYAKAYVYAREALSIAYTLRWHAFTLFCALKRILRVNND